MKKLFLSYLILSIIAGGILISCKKEPPCKGCKPPIALAGPDQVITLPTDSILLDGSASNDPDGTISGWLWKKISGPASFNIVNTTTAKTIVRNLDAGTYHFELQVKDDRGLFAKDTVQITVSNQLNRPPVANAGPDQTITLPVNTVNLDGSASTDPDNNITNYAWTKISGPASFNIANANTVQTQVTNLVEGVYEFELKVTDAGGLFSTDIIQVTVNPPITDPLNDVYVAGHENIGGRGVAKYWKNGQAISLSDGTIDTYANSIAVAGSDVYVAGYEKRGIIDVAKYWKKGQVVTLTNGLTTASATSIAVQGSDVYVAGYESNGSQNVAKYWKNGVAVSLTNGSTYASANSIVVVGSDVYVAGYESNGSREVAKYWKNGVGVSLTDGTIGSSAYSIAVVGNDVYVAGYEENNNNESAVYWKNGQKVVLSNMEAAAISITVVGADVYATGYWFRGGVGYWKNGDWVRLNGASSANSIFVKDNDIYVAGIISQSNAVYWKNGQMVSLTNGSFSGSANSIVVVRR